MNILDVNKLFNDEYLHKIITGINSSLQGKEFFTKTLYISIGKVESIEDELHKGRIQIRDIFLHSDNVPLTVLPYAERLLDERNFIIPEVEDFVLLLVNNSKHCLKPDYFYFGKITAKDDFWQDNYEEDLPKIDTLFKKLDEDSHNIQIDNNRIDKKVYIKIEEENGYLQEFTIDIENKKYTNYIKSSSNEMTMEIDIENIKSTFTMKDSTNSIVIENDVAGNKIEYTISAPSDNTSITFTNSMVTLECGSISSVSNVEVCGIIPKMGNSVNTVVRSDKLNSYLDFLINTQLNMLWKMTFNLHLHVGYIGNMGIPVVPVPNVQPQLQDLQMPNGMLETVGFETN